jgi:hypothetical protein
VTTESDWLEDDDLWFACGEDPALFVFVLRKRGRVQVPERWAPRKLPHPIAGGVSPVVLQ